jgi:hypothetical protein
MEAFDSLNVVGAYDDQSNKKSGSEAEVHRGLLCGTNDLES